jgi:hypothetical protein
MSLPPITVLTANSASSRLQQNGLDALGLLAPALSPSWAQQDPGLAGYNQAALTLTLTGARAPFRGVLEFVASAAIYADVNGLGLPGPAAVMRLHPEAVRRFERLVASRQGAAFATSLPSAMVFRNIPLPSPMIVPNWLMPGDPLVDLGGGAVTASFHDHRGLPVDPIAVAALYDDLLGAWPALAVGPAAAGPRNGPGGIATIATLATGTICHVIDPHGWGHNATRPAARLRHLAADGSLIDSVPNGGVVLLQDGETLGRTAAEDPNGGPLRWGLAQGGTLGRAPLAPPVPAQPTLLRRFFRVIAVDLGWHLIGNRAATVAGARQDVPPADQTTPAFLRPAVRDPVPNFAFLADGMAVLGAAVPLRAQPVAGTQIFPIMVSPVLDAALPLPPLPDATGHWPAFPVPGAADGAPPAGDLRTAITARWRAASDGPDAGRDVILEVPAGMVAANSHLRAYPRRFVEIPTIGETPSFRRDDGGAAMAVAGQPLRLLLNNPFALAPGQVPPTSPVVSFDLVLTPRTGPRRLFSELRVPVAVAAGADGNWAAQTALWQGQPVLMQPWLSGILDMLHTRGVFPSNLFGVPAPVFADAPGGDLLEAFLNETQPRVGPRRPTQMRFETVMVCGTAPAAGQTFNWQAVLTGARWSLDSRAWRVDLGNPGNPAGPDVMATGVDCSGWLAWDLALHAMKRATPIMPTSGEAWGWALATAGDAWGQPAADTAGTVAAVMLETIAPGSDTPELMLVPDPQPGDSISALADTIGGPLGLDPGWFTMDNDPDITRRVQLEIIAAKYGRRDTLWSLSRALTEARELIFIDGPAFAATALPSGPPLSTTMPAGETPPRPYGLDLVGQIVSALATSPRLKVVICLPREPDFVPPEAAGWVRAALAHRTAALQRLIAAAPARVAAFHPIGFPGRSVAIRSTTVIVDDVFCCLGTSHFRRRGMTFDGGVDVASIDRAMTQGYSTAIRSFRRRLMGERLGVDAATGPLDASPLWTRLAFPDGAFDAVADLLGQGGLGRCQPVWTGPTDTAVLPQTDRVADPDGLADDDVFAAVAGILAGF